MITYAIVSPEREEPWGYMRSPTNPTIEQLADHMASVTGYETRDDWIIEDRVNLLGIAPVH
ncbi:hypothetical protein [Paraburkholderia caledonica]|uniref:hypothetical protein n=1 Tax=Paraburkholderia caledonica TaxID=134536 RepID=UPI00037E98D2|nr:hypothetical protein [Paraburkholderia caledonica]